jgi:hypothetical protein
MNSHAAGHSFAQWADLATLHHSLAESRTAGDPHADGQCFRYPRGAT